MLDKLAEVEKRYTQLETLMSDPALPGRQREYSKIAKERSDLEELVTRYRAWKKNEQEIAANRELLNEEEDEAMRELAKEELGLLRERKEKLEGQLRQFLLPKDLKVAVMRASGPGGQSVNTTDSAVRMTHIPTGLVVSCQDEKSQHKNRAKALKILRARLLEKKQDEQSSEIAATRKLMVGSGDRSERIRTYNFPQGRMTDHRINFTLYKLDRVIEGELEELLDALNTHYQAEALQAG